MHMSKSSTCAIFLVASDPLDETNVATQKSIHARVRVCDIEKWHHEYYIYFAFQYMAKCVIMPFEGEVEQIQLCLNEQEYYFRLHFQALF